MTRKDVFSLPKRQQINMTANDFLVHKVLGGTKTIALVCLAILAYMAIDDSEQPDILVGALVSVLGQAVGSFTTFLTSTGPKPPPPLADGSVATTIVNTVEEPVPTEPVVDGDPEPEVEAEKPKRRR